jgi:hypothetical protein
MDVLVGVLWDMCVVVRWRTIMSPPSTVASWASSSGLRPAGSRLRAWNESPANTGATDTSKATAITALIHRFIVIPPLERRRMLTFYAVVLRRRSGKVPIASGDHEERPLC